MQKKAFTLVELLIYIAISTIILFALTDFVLSISQVNKKGVIISEVENQGLQIMNTISQKIRNADSIASPSVSASSSALTLNMVVAPSPIVFNISSGVFQIAQNGTTTPLNNNTVAMSNLVFTNLSRVGTPGVVKIEFKLKYNATSIGTMYDYEKTFYGTASLR